jgi:hypothetical protein
MANLLTILDQINELNSVRESERLEAKRCSELGIAEHWCTDLESLAELRASRPCATRHASPAIWKPPCAAFGAIGAQPGASLAPENIARDNFLHHF